MAHKDVPSMDWTSPNLLDTFNMFEQRIALFFQTKKVTAAADKVAHVLLQIGEEGLKRFNAMTLSEDEKKDHAIILTKLKEQLEPAENFRVSRLRLMGYRQKVGETIDSFVTRAKQQAKTCDFKKDEQDERIVELIIAGTPDQDFRKELLSKTKTFTLQQTLELGRQYEATAAHVRELQAMESSASGNTIDALQWRTQPAPCRNCGGKHKPRSCPAYGTKCSSCGKLNHWAKVCRSSASETREQRHQQNQQRTPTRRPSGGSGGKFHKNVHELEAGLEDSFETMTFNQIQISSMMSQRDEAYAKLSIQLTSRRGTHSLLLKADTGAQGNTLPLRLFREMFPDQVGRDGLPSKTAVLATRGIRLTAYNGTDIPCHGMVSLKCKYLDSQWEDTSFYIVDVPGPAILGLTSCENLRVVTMHCSISSTPPNSAQTQQLSLIHTVNDLMRAYPDQFDRIGKLPGPVKLVVCPDIPPHVDAPRKTPIALKDAIKAELDSMESSGVIRRVTEPTDWVSSLAYSHKKGGALRICLDPRHLNRALKRPHHKIPTVEELTHKFQGATVFSKLDAKSGYWSVQLDDASQLLTTFQSPFGRYCFTRLPFGLSVSQDVFQHKMDQILDQVEGVVGIADDVAVYAKSDEEHNQVLHNLMRTASQNGLVFNSDKCFIKTDSITFFGMTYDANGVHPDPGKVNDLRHMPTPTNKAELQMFLGFVQFLAPFIQNLSERSAVLRDLLKKDAAFIWEESHQACFEQLKAAITEKSTLRYFNTSKTPTLQVDASIKGLGASLLQDGEPIAYASKSLSDAETRYACIERELLAIVFGVQRFHTYLYGRPFHVITDHKPLVMIMEKPLTKAPPRLQRMLLKLQGYNFNIEYRAGKELPLPDTLSRLPNRDNKQTLDLDIRVNLVRFSADCLLKVHQETKNDPTLSKLMEIVVQGWPQTVKELPETLRPYWSYRDELSIEDGIILKGERIIIPSSMKAKILNQLHCAHQGIEKTKLLARDSVYWNNINSDIEKMVKSCPVCQEHQPAQQRETLLPHDIPNRPWETVGADFFQLNGKDYLIVADYFSKYFLVRKFDKDCSSLSTIKALKQMFAEQGIPAKVITDNGPQFSAASFAEFAKEWSFTHTTSSPRYPRSNGFIERQVQTVKATLTKALQSHSDPDLALLCIRTTPISATIPSPMQIMTGRKARFTIPLKHSPTSERHENARDELLQRQETQKMYHDKQAKDLPTLHPGQPVRVQDSSGKWQEAEVVEKCNEPRSYIVATPSGQSLRRNRVHLRPSPKAESTPELDIQPSPGTETVTKPTAIQQDVQPQPTVNAQPGNQAPYRTRAGRIVKPPRRYGDE